ncbi:MAG: hypothetical protein ACRENI_08660 [Gemmatimonadaceae bacterium]
MTMQDPQTREQIREEVARIREEVQSQIREAQAEARAAEREARAGQPAPDGGSGGRGGEPGVVVTPFPPFESFPRMPRETVGLAVAFFILVAVIIIGLPIARALGRRIENRGRIDASADLTDRLQRIEHAVEAVAVEVERISEGQRYTTRLLAEREPEALPASRQRS